MALARVAAKRQQPVLLQRPPPAPGRPAPHHTSGQLPAVAQSYLPVVSQQVREVMGFSPPPRCDQTSLTFPQRLPALAGGLQPRSQQHFQANSCFFCTLYFS